MTVADNGSGFNTREIKIRPGVKGSLGLTSMRERADLIGAKFEIESKPGRGTVVKAEAPLPDHIDVKRG